MRFISIPGLTGGVKGFPNVFMRRIQKDYEEYKVNQNNSILIFDKHWSIILKDKNNSYNILKFITQSLCWMSKQQDFQSLIELIIEI